MRFSLRKRRQGKGQQGRRGPKNISTTVEGYYIVEYDPSDRELRFHNFRGNPDYENYYSYVVRPIKTAGQESDGQEKEWLVAVYGSNNNFDHLCHVKVEGGELEAYPLIRRTGMGQGYTYSSSRTGDSATVSTPEGEVLVTYMNHTYSFSPESRGLIKEFDE